MKFDITTLQGRHDLYDELIRFVKHANWSSDKDILNNGLFGHGLCWLVSQYHIHTYGNSPEHTVDLFKLHLPELGDVMPIWLSHISHMYSTNEQGWKQRLNLLIKAKEKAYANLIQT